MPVKVGLRFIDLWNTSLEDQVRVYEQENAEKGQIVFYGSSEFTRWSKQYGMKPMREVLLGKNGAQCVVNRGFGSSCSEHQLYYYPRMVRSLEPRVFVYSPFGNYGNFGYTEEEAWELAQRVVAYARTDFPAIHIYLCGAHPRRDATPAWKEKAKCCNSFLKEYVAANPDCTFIDVMGYEPLERTDIFVEDGIHFNQSGYDIYAELFRDALKDELARYGG